ncbi:MAG: DUF1820 family protein [Rhodanobacteraceae bacterium]|nr:DUF1820 family protein [Rhodanobacteraceae bacterium]
MNTLYKVTFINNGKSYEIYARHVGTSHLWGFTEVGQLVFEPRGEGLVVDPTEERLREEFQHTRTLHLPMHAIVKVEEVERRSPASIRDAANGEKITPFPFPPARPK